MPKLTFDEKEILLQGKAVVNASGNIYIDNGRKYQGKKVYWVILKDEGSNTPPEKRKVQVHTNVDAELADIIREMKKDPLTDSAIRGYARAFLGWN